MEADIRDARAKTREMHVVLNERVAEPSDRESLVGKHVVKLSLQL